jgi:hypothetical protein
MAIRRAGCVRGAHAVRPAYASYLAWRVALPIVSAMLGHAAPKTAARYAQGGHSSLALDPRLHLTFSGTSGTVRAMDPVAHTVHTDLRAGRDRS